MFFILTSMFFTTMVLTVPPTKWRVCVLLTHLFLPRDVFAWRGLYRGKMSVCTSVCPSQPVFYLNGYIYPQMFFTVVFPYQTGWQHSDGNASNARVYEKKFTIVDQYLALSRK